MKKSLLLICAVFLFSSISAQLTNLPNNLNDTKLAGRWEFKSAATATTATKGNDLTIKNEDVTYWQEVDGTGTMRLDKPTISNGGGMPVEHGLGTGSDKIQSFCLLFDVKIDANKGGGTNLSSLYWNETKGDGCIFFGFSDSPDNRKNKIGFSSYSGEIIKPGEWQRILLNFDLANSVQDIYVIYEDQTFVKYTGAGGKNDNYLTADKKLVLLGDNATDSEYGRLNVSQIALFSTYLNEDDLEGLGIEKPKPPVYPNLSSGDDSNETWYYILNRRGTGVWTDTGTGNPLDCFFPMNGYEDAQLWKFVGENINDIKIVNKLGNEIAYNATANENLIADRYYTTTGGLNFRIDQNSYEFPGYVQERVFSIYDKANDGHVDKSNWDTGYGKWKSTTGDGTAVVFLLPSEITKIDPPKFSNNEKEYWYTIQFNSGSANSFTDTGNGNRLALQPTDTSLPAQLWKFEGSLSNMKIISYMENSPLYRETDATKVSSTTVDAADSFKFEVCNGHWAIKNLSQIRDTYDNHYFYLNRSGTTVTLYTLSNVDTPLTFTEVEVGTTTWNGTNAEWNNQANWSDGTPTVLKNVIIPSQSTIPAIPEDGAVIGNLILEEGAQLEISGDLTVSRKIHVEKTVNPGVWYPVGFPYAIEGAYHYSDVDGFDEFPFLNPYDGTAKSDYWVRSYNGTTFDDATTYATGEGRIVQFPTYFTDKTITFVSDANQTITNATVTPEENVYKLVANPTLKEMEVTSENGVYYYKYDGTNFNLIKESQSDVMLPFEAFIVVKDPATLRSIIGGEDGYTSIDTVINRGEDGDEITGTRYYNLQGIEINKPTEESADKGAYIRKDIYKSGKESTSKVINIKK